MENMKRILNHKSFKLALAIITALAIIAALSFFNFEVKMGKSQNGNSYLKFQAEDDRFSHFRTLRENDPLSDKVIECARILGHQWPSYGNDYVFNGNSVTISEYAERASVPLIGFYIDNGVKRMLPNKAGSPAFRYTKFFGQTAELQMTRLTGGEFSCK